MESQKYNPVLISQLVHEYNENINKKYKNKIGFIENSINNIKTTYNNIHENIYIKLHKSYTYNDLDNEKNLTYTEFKIKESGIILGNLITNIIVECVDKYHNLFK
uniref:Uncharacterized protein n=1 Tax=viral metagenome TaxID=1070528 RepID=A0A6C0AXM5_9ZZZZ|tara:strand:- start:3794 stop:4108 length:315 start_codon:yes stop_codon:yes gene_type:complete